MQRHAKPHRARLFPLLLATIPLLALAGTAFVAVLPRGAEAATTQGRVSPPPPTAPAVPSAGDAPREAVPGEPQVTPAASRPTLDFRAEVEAIVTLGEATSAHVQDDEIALARHSDAEARRRFETLLAEFPDAGERGLDCLLTIPATSTEPRDVGRRLVLQLVLAAEITRRHEQRDATTGGCRSDALVGALVRTLSAQEPIAQLGARILTGQPFLHLCHEPDVLLVVQQASRGEVPQQVAAGLLQTLWDNLLQRGERSSAELASLALVLLANPDASQRMAACRHLLLDGRFRSVVLAWVREHQDRTVADDLANIAARELAPREALAVLKELAPIVGNVPHAYLAVGMRDTAAVADAYRELLAGSQHPTLRADLIAGMATGNPAEALPVLELAQTSDPTPAVRSQALLTLTAAAAARHGEAAFDRALADPALRSDPHQLALFVLALQNLEFAGLTNAVDRYGQQLRNLPLREDSRNLLEQLLSHALPGGMTSDQWAQAGRPAGGQQGSRAGR